MAYTHNTLLNADITCEEVSAALNRLKRNKAAGVDGIKAEFILKCFRDDARPTCDHIMITFNQALEHGVPAAWCVGVIQPLSRLETGKTREITGVLQWL